MTFVPRDGDRYVVGGPGPREQGDVAVLCIRCGGTTYLSSADIDRPGQRLCNECADRIAKDIELDLSISEAALHELAEMYGISVDEAFKRAEAAVWRDFGKHLHRGDPPDAAER